MNREEFREQMTRCNVCGALMDGGCCPPPPLAIYIESERDTWVGPMEYHVEAVVTREYWCLDCANEPDFKCKDVTEVFDKRELRYPYGSPIECCNCGKDLS